MSHLQYVVYVGFFTIEKTTLLPDYNELGYYEHPSTTSRFVCIKIIDSNVENFGYYKHPPTASSFLCIYLLVISGTQCISSFDCHLMWLTLLFTALIKARKLNYKPELFRSFPFESGRQRFRFTERIYTGIERNSTGSTSILMWIRRSIQRHQSLGGTYTAGTSECESENL